MAADPEAMGEVSTTARALKRLIEASRGERREPLRFGVMFPCSSHSYRLRYWLLSGGIDPNRDMRILVVPPTQMAVHLRDGRIDGYCVGEPWNTLAAEDDIGCVLITSYEVWNNHPEKVFGVTREWARTDPHTHRAILVALLEAARWLDEAANRAEAARLLSRPEYVDAPASALRAGLLDQFRFHPDGHARPLPDFHVFHRYEAAFPCLSHAEWLIAQMLRWRQLRAPVNITTAADSVYRPDLYREAAVVLGLPCPPSKRKVESKHDEHWLLTTAAEAFAMGSDRFFDDGKFEPAEISNYPNRCSMNTSYRLTNR